MKTTACILVVMASACLSVRADDTAGTRDSQIDGDAATDVPRRGPAAKRVVGLEVYYGKFFNNDMVHGIRPIYLDAQGREQLGSLRGKDNGAPRSRQGEERLRRGRDHRPGGLPSMASR